MSTVKEEIECYRNCIILAEQKKMRGNYLDAVIDLENAIRSLNELHMLGITRKDNWLKHEQTQADMHQAKTLMDKR